MADHKVKAKDLNERAPLIEVSGTLQFSRLLSRIQGEELARFNAQKSARGMFTKSSPYITFTLENPRVTPTSGDDQKLTKEEFYVHERFYERDNEEGVPTKYYSLEASVGDKGSLPIVIKRESNEAKEDGTYDYKQVSEPAGEIAPGTPVRIMLEVYKPKSQQNRGLAIRTIAVEDDEIDFLTPNAGLTSKQRKDLKARGIIIKGDIVPTKEASATPSEEREAGSASTDSDGLPTAMTPSADSQQTNDDDEEFFVPEEPEAPSEEGFYKPSNNDGVGISFTDD